MSKGFEQLPPEIFTYHINRFLDVPDRARLRQVSKYLHKNVDNFTDLEKATYRIQQRLKNGDQKFFEMLWLGYIQSTILNETKMIWQDTVEYFQPMLLIDVAHHFDQILQTILPFRTVTVAWANIDDQNRDHLHIQSTTESTTLKVLFDFLMNHVDEPLSTNFTLLVINDTMLVRADSNLLNDLVENADDQDMIDQLLSIGFVEHLFIRACKDGQLDLLLKVFNQGVDMNRGLAIASAFGRLDVVKFLVEHGADVRTYQPIINATMFGHLDVVKYLIQHGANVHEMDDQPIQNAAFRGYLDVVKYLVSKGANIHVNDDWALKYAAQDGHLDVVKYLISKGASQLEIALQMAQQSQEMNVVDYLQQTIRRRQRERR